VNHLTGPAAVNASPLPPGINLLSSHVSSDHVRLSRVDTGVAEEGFHDGGVTISGCPVEGVQPSCRRFTVGR